MGCALTSTAAATGSGSPSLSRTEKISAAEALEAAIARAEAINPRLNAIVARMD